MNYQVIILNHNGVIIISQTSWVLQLCFVELGSVQGEGASVEATQNVGEKVGTTDCENLNIIDIYKHVYLYANLVICEWVQALGLSL
jgi:hypothetical protein